MREEKGGSASGDAIQQREVGHEVHEHKVLSFQKNLRTAPSIPLPRKFVGMFISNNMVCASQSGGLGHEWTGWACSGEQRIWTGGVTIQVPWHVTAPVDK